MSETIHSVGDSCFRSSAGWAIYPNWGYNRPGRGRAYFEQLCYTKFDDAADPDAQIAHWTKHPVLIVDVVHIAGDGVYELLKTSWQWQPHFNEVAIEKDERQQIIDRFTSAFKTVDMHVFADSDFYAAAGLERPVVKRDYEIELSDDGVIRFLKDGKTKTIRCRIDGDNWEARYNDLLYWDPPHQAEMIDAEGDICLFTAQLSMAVNERGKNFNVDLERAKPGHPASASDAGSLLNRLGRFFK